MQMILGPRTGPLSMADLSWAYAWPRPPGQGWLRVMMLFTLDGGVSGSDGRSGSISSRLDRAVLSEVRSGCDAVLIGAGTFRAERYRPLTSEPEVAARRTAAGLAAVPRLVIVSSGLELPWQEDAFAASPLRPLVVTLDSVRPEVRHAAEQHAEVLSVPGPDLDAHALLEVLAGAGLHRVVCEGGPGLLASLSRAGLIDEAVISIAPTLTGGGQLRTGPATATPWRLRPEQVILADDGFLFTRYRRAEGAA